MSLVGSDITVALLGLLLIAIAVIFLMAASSLKNQSQICDTLSSPPLCLTYADGAAGTSQAHYNAYYKKIRMAYDMSLITGIICAVFGALVLISSLVAFGRDQKVNMSLGSYFKKKSARRRPISSGKRRK